MSLDPWIIERLEEEERQRREDDEARRSRIELPQTLPDAPAPAKRRERDERREPEGTGLQIVDISPPSENTIDL
jgi:hypothetical protein